MHPDFYWKYNRFFRLFYGLTFIRKDFGVDHSIFIVEFCRRNFTAVFYFFNGPLCIVANRSNQDVEISQKWILSLFNFTNYYSVSTGDLDKLAGIFNCKCDCNGCFYNWIWSTLKKIEIGIYSYSIKTIFLVAL